jgi:CheY-like chemotaxis protein
MARTILVADDNPIILKMVHKMFEAEVDYELCAEAANGQEAISLALQCRPELIILDLSMPLINGLEAARELKRIMPRVPIILFTLYAAKAVNSDLPVDMVVSKNDPGSLMRHVREILPA